MLRPVILALSLMFALTRPLVGAELIMVEEPGCAWCAKWERELGAIYPQTPEGAFAPLRKAQLHEIRKNGDLATLNATLARPVTFTPTFILIEDGQELARLQGYPGEDFFWGVLGQMLTEHTLFRQAPAQ